MGHAALNGKEKSMQYFVANFEGETLLGKTEYTKRE
jgi:hypothetical protein